MTTIISTPDVLIADSLHFIETISGWDSTFYAGKINFLECERVAYAISGCNQFSPAALENLQTELRLIVGKLNINGTVANADMRESLLDFIKDSGEFEIILVTRNRGRWLISTKGITYIPERVTVALGSGASRWSMTEHLLGEYTLEELLVHLARHEVNTQGPWTRLQLSSLKEFTDATD